MGYPTKIATCCYCGSRAALVLGQDRHELSCASCGAPLHDMKRLRQDPERDRPRGHYPTYSGKYQKGVKKHAYEAPRRAPKKRRKGLMRHLIEEAFDVIEDIFD